MISTDAGAASHFLTARRARVLVAILLAAYICAFADRVVMTLLVDPVKSAFGISDTEVSLLTGVAFGIFYVVANVPAGMLTDRLPRRAIIAGSILVWSAMSVASGFAGSFWALFVGRAGVGVAEAFITPACFSLIREKLAPEWRNRAFSLMGMAPFIGGAVAMIGGGAILAAGNRGTFAGWPVIATLQPWQMVLVMLGVAGIPIAVLALALPRDPRNRATIARDAGAGLKAIATHLKTVRQRFLLLLAYVTCGALVGFALGAWMPAAMGRRFGLPLDQVGKIAGAITVTTAPLGLVLGGIVLDRLIARGADIRIYGAITLTIGTACVATMPLVETASAAWILYAAALFFTSSTYPVASTTLGELTPGPMMGTVTVLYFLPQNILGGALAATIVAGLSDAFFTGPGAIGDALAMHCSVFGMLGVVSALLLGRAMRAEHASA